MTILENDINKYKGFLEFAQDGLFNCHPNDEKRFQTLIFHYTKILSSLKDLNEILKSEGK